MAVSASSALYFLDVNIYLYTEFMIDRCCVFKAKTEEWNAQHPHATQRYETTLRGSLQAAKNSRSGQGV